MTSYIYSIIRPLAVDLKKVHNISDEIGGVNLLEFTDKKIAEAVDIYNRISDDPDLIKRCNSIFMG